MDPDPNNHGMWSKEAYGGISGDDQYYKESILTSTNLERFQNYSFQEPPRQSLPPHSIDFKTGPASDTSSVTAPDIADESVMALGRLHLGDPSENISVRDLLSDQYTFEEAFPERRSSCGSLDIPAPDILQHERHGNQLRSTAPPFEPQFNSGPSGYSEPPYQQQYSSPPPYGQPSNSGAMYARNAIPPHVMMSHPMPSLRRPDSLMKSNSQRSMEARERPYPMLKSNSDNRIYGASSSRQNYVGGLMGQVQRPSSAASRMVSAPHHMGSGPIPSYDIDAQYSNRSVYLPHQAQVAQSMTPPPPDVPLQVLSLDVNGCFQSTEDEHTTERNSIYDFIEECGSQVVLMNNTGLEDEEQLRIVRNEVKAKYHTESAMWASFKTAGPEGGRGVAVLILGPLAPRTGWIRSDSRGHMLSASSRVKPGLPVLSFVACDLHVDIPEGPETTATSAEMFSAHLTALREMMKSEQEKGSYIVAGGLISGVESAESSAYSFNDLGIHSLHNRMTHRSGSVGGEGEEVRGAVGDDVFISLQTKADDPFGIKVAKSEYVERTFKNSKSPSIVAVSVGGWPQEAFIKQKGNKSPDNPSNKKSRSRPNSASKAIPRHYAPGGYRGEGIASSPHSHYSPPPPHSIESLSHYHRPLSGHQPPPQRSSPVVTERSVYMGHSQGHSPGQRPHSGGRPLSGHSSGSHSGPHSGHSSPAYTSYTGPPVSEARPLSGPSESSSNMSVVNDMLTWRMNVIEALNILDHIMATTDWGVVRLDQMKHLIQDIFCWIDNFSPRIGYTGFADSASIAALKSLKMGSPEQLLDAGPDMIKQILKTWHYSTDQAIHRLSSK